MKIYYKIDQCFFSFESESIQKKHINYVGNELDVSLYNLQFYDLASAVEFASKDFAVKQDVSSYKSMNPKLLREKFLYCVNFDICNVYEIDSPYGLVFSIKIEDDIYDLLGTIKCGKFISLSTDNPYFNLYSEEKIKQIISKINNDSLLKVYEYNNEYNEIIYREGGPNFANINISERLLADSVTKAMITFYLGCGAKRYDLKMEFKFMTDSKEYGYKVGEGFQYYKEEGIGANLWIEFPTYVSCQEFLQNFMQKSGIDYKMLNQYKWSSEKLDLYNPYLHSGINMPKNISEIEKLIEIPFRYFCYEFDN